MNKLPNLAQAWDNALFLIFMGRIDIKIETWVFIPVKTTLTLFNEWLIDKLIKPVHVIFMKCLLS